MKDGAQVLVFANVKGGVTKTTTVLTTAMMLHLLGARVLVVDADPQGNTTDGLGYTGGALTHTLYTLMMGKSTLEQVLKRTYFNRTTRVFYDPTDDEERQQLELDFQEKQSVRGPDLLPNNLRSAAAENELLPHPAWGSLIRGILLPLAPLYDFVIIDTNPGLGKLTVNSFLAADYVVIPSIPERWPTDGISLLCGTIANARDQNKALTVLGILFTRVRYAEHRRHMEYVQQSILPQINKAFPWMQLTCFETYINETANFSKVTNERSNYVLALVNDPISIMYWGYLAELLRKMGSPFFEKALTMYQQLVTEYKAEQALQEKRKQQRAETGGEKR
jgi:chromosome partitioning protein